MVNWAQRITHVRALWRVAGEQATMTRGVEKISSADGLDAISAEPTAAPSYPSWFTHWFGVYSSAPNTFPATSWTLADSWGQKINDKMVEVEIEYAESLLLELEKQNLRGPVVEFGVFRGDWLLNLLNSCERNDLARQFYGFDSFQGLPRPSDTFDLDCWAEGDYAASRADVAARLGAERRPNVHLLEGWFSDSLITPEAQALRDISFARIDCDLYDPAVECLEFLSERLSNGAVLVFDDWTFDLGKGETKAFDGWIRRRPELRCEFLCFTGIGHMYMRVWRR